MIAPLHDIFKVIGEKQHQLPCLSSTFLSPACPRNQLTPGPPGKKEGARGKQARGRKKPVTPVDSVDRVDGVDKKTRPGLPQGTSLKTPLLAIGIPLRSWKSVFTSAFASVDKKAAGCSPGEGKVHADFTDKDPGHRFRGR